MTRYAQILILCILSICLIGGVVAAAGTDGVTAPENGSMMVAPGLDVEPAETETPLDEEIPAAAGETVTAAPNPASTIILGSATVEAGKPAVIPVKVANLTEIEGIGGWVFYDQGAGTVTSVNLTGPLAGADLTYNADHPGHLQFAITTTEPFTAGATPVQIAEIRFDTYRETPGNYTLYPEATYSTEFNESYFEHAVEGWLNTTPPPLPDLVGYLDPAPPQYIKKYSNGTIYMNPTFVIGNIGVAGVTDDIVTMVAFVGERANYTVNDDIAAGGNYTIFTDITIDPSYTGALNVVEVKGTGSVKLIITAGGDISPGNKQVSIDINPDHTIEELRYDNNFIEAQTTVTYTDLRPILDITQISGLSSSNTTIQEDVLPGTYRVTYGVENRAPGVYSEPTWLRVSKNGVNTTYEIPALQPGENWTKNETINLDRYAGSVTYTVKANAAGRSGEEPKERIKYPDSGTVSKTIEKEYASFKPVTVIFPRINVTSDVSSVIPIELKNISSGAPVVSFSIPVTYDPSVVRFLWAEWATPGVTVSSTGYGRLLVKGDGLSLSTDTKVVDLRFISQSESGRTSEIGSTKDAYVKTTNNRYLELDITKGALVQDSVTDASVYLWAPTASPVDSNVTVYVYVYNSKATPVNVSANVTTGGTVLWSQDEVALGAYQTRYFWVDTWKPSATGTYTLTARIAGDDKPTGNSASTTVRIDPYELNITPQNRQYWESYYGYNVTAVQDQYFSLGTYFTANQPGYVNASLSIWYANGTPVDLSKDRPFYLYYYPAKRQIYSYSSSWNSAMWYYIRPMELGTYNYSISLESHGKQTYVNGTIVVREQNVDIKVLNSTTLDDETGGEILFDVFNREPSEGREVVITAAAGAEGRTLQGLDYLIGYPHGCPEQTMSPALAVLRVKQYYESRGQLNDERNATYQAAMLEAYNRMKAPDGYNAQQLPMYTGYGDQSGGWAWGQNSVPSMFYTLYPNYVFSELRQDMDKDPDYWGFNLTNTSEINLTASTVWLLNKQGTNGGWSDWGYISNSYEWTGFISEKFVGEFGYLTPEGQRMVNESLNRSFDYLVRGNYDRQSATPVAYAVFGIDSIRDHYADNATLNAQADAKLAELQNRLIALRQGDAVNGYYWSYWAYEDTANAVLALNRTGLPADNETVRGGIRYLVGVYDTNGRWGSTRGTAAVIEALTQVQIPSSVNFDVQIGVEDGSGAVIRDPQTYTFNNTNARVSFKLDGNQIADLYGSTGANRTGKITITGKTDAGSDATELVVAVQSRQKVPKSIAFATIPDEFIDPIATDLFLDVTVPAPETGIVVGDTVDVAFTVSNTGDNRTMLILEIPTGDGVTFDGREMAADMAYYMDDGSKVNISHMYNATAKTLYVYPGSDNESQPSVVSGEVKNFFVPLNFTKSGDVSVEARIYPMYDDENMALGNATAYVKGYGNLTLSVVDESLAPLNADFYIDDMTMPVASGASNITREVLEGKHNVSIIYINDTVTRTVNTTLTVNTGEATEYSAQIATDPTIPHISMVVGDAGDVRIMPPEINDTISEDSLYYWSALTPAKKTFNSTISSTGGTATIAVEVPVVVREPTAVVNPTTPGWRPNSTTVDDSVTYRYHNVSASPPVWQGPFDVKGNISEGILLIEGVNTGDVDQIAVEFNGRKLGDVGYDGRVNVQDALQIVRYVVGLDDFSTNDRFYGDVNNDGKANVQDALGVVRHVVRLDDEHYQPI